MDRKKYFLMPLKKTSVYLAERKKEFKQYFDKIGYGYVSHNESLDEDFQEEVYGVIPTKKQSNIVTVEGLVLFGKPFVIMRELKGFIPCLVIDSNVAALRLNADNPFFSDSLTRQDKEEIILGYLKTFLNK